MILTNPPFGGEEERGIQNNFPADKQTAETALLFLQLIMRLLRKKPAGRAAVVVPNGTLFGDGVCGRIKHELLTNFNLHTVVRLPNGVFAPYTAIPDERALLRPHRADGRRVVLRAAAARRPEELHQDGPDAVRGVRRLPGVVGRPAPRPTARGRCRRRS